MTQCGIIAVNSMKHSDQSDHPISPYSLYKVVTSFAALFGIIRSGVSPTEFDSKAWYDRTIRVVGALIILLVLAAGFALLIAEHFKHSN